MTQKTKSNGKSEYSIEPDQLCWNCKRCTNPDDLPCPWAENFTLVERWTAAPGRQYFDYLPGGGKELDGQSYAITACPLFVKDKPFTTYGEALQYIAETLNLTLGTVRGRPIYYFKQYEEITGEKIPYWVWEENLGWLAIVRLEREWYGKEGDKT